MRLIHRAGLATPGGIRDTFTTVKT